MDEIGNIHVGLDVHKDSISVGVAEPGRGAARTPRAVACGVRGGPTGYGLQRSVAQAGYSWEVIAPSQIPRRAGDRVKTDGRDCIQLAECSRAGQLRAVWIPEPADEAIRHGRVPGMTKAATLEMLKREIGKVKLTALSTLVLRDFIDRRTKAGAGGDTIAADLSFLSAVLKWARHARHLDVNDRLALDARESLKHGGYRLAARNASASPRTRSAPSYSLLDG